VSLSTKGSRQQDELARLGVRYVREEEDQVRWEDDEGTLYESKTNKAIALRM
jgi:hypothetical protein